MDELLAAIDEELSHPNQRVLIVVPTNLERAVLLVETEKAFEDIEYVKTLGRLVNQKTGAFAFIRSGEDTRKDFYSTREESLYYDGFRGFQVHTTILLDPTLNRWYHQLCMGCAYAARLGDNPKVITL